ncbi:MAG: carbon-nitrogen family hydrolase [Terracidiphilus sp.]|jgi:predicted amidohydrolase
MTQRNQSLRIALAQFDVKSGKTAQNLATATEYLALAAGQGAHLVVLPELWSSGYDLEHCRIHAQASQYEVLPALSKLARRHRIYVVGSVLKANASREVFNSAVLLGPGTGAVRAYHKIHLFGPMREDRFLTPGRTTPIFQMPFGPIALAICYDLRFPELFRKYALGGAQLVVVCAQWPAPRLEHWRTLVRARAIENQFFVVACNRMGSSQGTRFAGHSMIVDPWGNVLREGGSRAGLITEDIDFQAVNEARSRIPALRDRRPAVY